jgi:hypothetical protein
MFGCFRDEQRRDVKNLRVLARNQRKYGQNCKEIGVKVAKKYAKKKKPAARAPVSGTRQPPRFRTCAGAFSVSKASRKRESRRRASCRSPVPGGRKNIKKTPVRYGMAEMGGAYSSVNAPLSVQGLKEAPLQWAVWRWSVPFGPGRRRLCEP